MQPVPLRLESVVSRRGPLEVLRGLSLSVPAGGSLALLGPSGSGKTSVLRLLAGLDRPDRGRALLGDRDAASVPPRERDIGFVFQDLALWPYLTAAGHLESVRPGSAREGLVRFGLEALADRRPGALSGGERQRLALARALASGPGLLLLDEPFSHLDPPGRRAAAAALLDYRRATGATLVAVSHHLDAFVETLDRVALLHEGRLLQEGTLPDLRSRPADARVADFVAAGAPA
jgi:ABC-type Fe3+/spermidine/putrescine transport system ATPase subunit